MKFTYGAVLPLPIEQAFDFLSNPANWSDAYDFVEYAEAREGWGAVGGKGTKVTKILGRTATSHLELVVWDRPHEFRYIGHSEGQPDMDMRRVFEAVPEGTRLTSTTVLSGKLRPTFLLDLIALAALRRALHRGMKTLPARALEFQSKRGTNA